VKVRLVQVAGMKFEGVTEDGARTVVHVPAKGEAKEGPSPFEHLVIGLAGCTAADVVSILEKQHQPLKRLEIEVDYERAKEHPRRLVSASLHFIAHGEGLDPGKLKRAIDLSQEKYCSVSATVRGGGAVLTCDQRIVVE